MRRKSSKRSEKVCIIGAGPVGLAWGRALNRIGCKISCVISRKLSHAKRLAKDVGAAEASNRIEKCCGSTIVLLCVPDHAIKEVSDQLLNVHFTSSRVVVAHCSGSRSSVLLESLKSNTSAVLSVASAHPMQTFPRKLMYTDTWDPIRDICFGLEGDIAAKTRLRNLIKALHCRSITISPDSKALYHMGGVIVSNFLHANYHAARKLYKGIGINASQTRLLLGPILFETLRNILSNPSSIMLTGPASRGDYKLLGLQSSEIKKALPTYQRAFVALTAYCRLLSEETR